MAKVVRSGEEQLKQTDRELMLRAIALARQSKCEPGKVAPKVGAVIARAGKPVARLVPYRQAEGPREGGQWRGQVHVAPDFDELPPNIGEAFGLSAK